MSVTFHIEKETLYIQKSQNMILPAQLNQDRKKERKEKKKEYDTSF